MKVFLISICTLISVITTAQNNPPTAQQIRGMIEGQIKQLNVAPTSVFKVENKTIWTGSDSVKIRIYYPNKSKDLPLIFNIHGGALVAGNLDSHDNISRLLCKESNAVVVALDYRLPPENPFPAGFNDTWAVLKWINGHHSELGTDKNKIIITSDSGGSLFAAAIPTRIQKEKSDVKLNGMIFINPAVDLRIDSASPPNPMYQLVSAWYLGKTPATDSMASPMAAKDFSMFPKTLVVVCSNDELKPQGVQFEKKLHTAKVQSTLFEVPNEDHYGGFWAAAHARAKPALDQALSFLASLR